MFVRKHTVCLTESNDAYVSLLFSPRTEIWAEDEQQLHEEDEVADEEGAEADDQYGEARSQAHFNRPLGGLG
jgi:hypothetical protein